MTEILHFPIHFQEPEDPRITELAREEVAALRRDIDTEARYYGREKALAKLQEPHGDDWTLATDNERRTLFRSLAGQTVVDLGCGRSDKFRKLLLGEKIGAYIGVEIFLDRPEPGIPVPPIGTVYPLPETTPSFLVEADMLDVVSRLPDNSCSFALNGIDNMILEPYSPYTEELARQIDRATRAGGVVVGLARYSGILNELVANPGYASSSRGLTYATHATVMLHEKRHEQAESAAL